MHKDSLRSEPVKTALQEAKLTISSIKPTLETFQELSWHFQPNPFACWTHMHATLFFFPSKVLKSYGICSVLCRSGFTMLERLVESDMVYRYGLQSAKQILYLVYIPNPLFKFNASDTIGSFPYLSWKPISRMDAHKTPCGLRVAPCCRIDTSCCLLLAILNDSWASLLKPVNFYISSMLSWTLLNNECFIYYSTLLASAGPSSSEGWWRLVWRPHGGRRLRKSGTLDLQQCDFGLSIQPNT